MQTFQQAKQMKIVLEQWKNTFMIMSIQKMKPMKKLGMLLQIWAMMD